MKLSLYISSRDVNSVDIAVRERVNNDDTWREEERKRGRGVERKTEKVHFMQRIIVAEKEHDECEGAYRRVCDATGVCFATCVSYQLSSQRDRRELPVCQCCTQRVQWFAASRCNALKKQWWIDSALTWINERFNDIWINFCEDYFKLKRENKFWIIGLR